PPAPDRDPDTDQARRACRPGTGPGHPSCICRSAQGWRCRGSCLPGAPAAAATGRRWPSWREWSAPACGARWCSYQATARAWPLRQFGLALRCCSCRVLLVVGDNSQSSVVGGVDVDFGGVVVIHPLAVACDDMQMVERVVAMLDQRVVLLLDFQHLVGATLTVACKEVVRFHFIDVIQESLALELSRMTLLGFEFVCADRIRPVDFVTLDPMTPTQRAYAD